MFDVDADSRDDCVEVFVAAGAGLVGRFPVGGMGAVDEDEVPLLNRLDESTRKEEQDRFKEDSDTSPDPEDRGLTNSQEVDDHHLGQVLTKDQQTRHPTDPAGDTASEQIHPSTLDHIGDTAGDLANCFLAKPRCGLVTHQLLS